MGAARVPRTSFKTAYTSKKTRMTSAILRGSLSLPRYSVYGSINNISEILDLRFAIQELQFSFTNRDRNPRYLFSQRVPEHNPARSCRIAAQSLEKSSQ